MSVRVREIKSVLYISLPPCSLLSEFGRGSPGAPVAVMACSWLLWYRLGILALMMCKMSKQCLWHLQMAPPWPVLPNCSLIHGNGKHFFKWLPDACIRHNTTHPAHQNNSSPCAPSAPCHRFSQVFTQMDKKKRSPEGEEEVFAKSSLRYPHTGLQRSLRGLDRIVAACRSDSTAGLSTKTPWGANLVHRSTTLHLLHAHSNRGITVLGSPTFLTGSTLIFRSNKHFLEVLKYDVQLCFNEGQAVVEVLICKNTPLSKSPAFKTLFE